MERNCLEHNFGKDSFKVPEGYFEGLTASVMSSLPDTANTVVTHKHRRSVFLYPAICAACVCGLLFGAWMYVRNNFSGSELVMTDSAADNNESMVDQVADYAMLDKHDFYTYIDTDY